MPTKDLEKMSNCSCGRFTHDNKTDITGQGSTLKTPEKAIFYCKSKDCPFNKSQPYFCAQCMEEEDRKHNHLPISVWKVVTKQEGPKWQTFDKEFQNELSKITDIYGEYAEIIEKFDEACEKELLPSKKSLKAEFKALEELNKEFQQTKHQI